MKKSPEIEHAIRAAKEAGKLLMEHFGNIQTYTKKSAEEIVTPIDREAETIIRNVLKERFPTYGFTGEEKFSSNATEDIFWTVDPLDGTTNYVQGCCDFSVSIALIKNKHPTAGVIYNPYHKELYHAEQGTGTFRNKEPVHVSKTVHLQDAVVEFNAGYGHRSELGEFMKRIGEKIRQPQICHPTSRQFSELCAGRVDAYVRIFSGKWDTAAGKILVEEAGGVTKNFNNQPFQYTQNHYIAGNSTIQKKLFEELSPLLKKYSGKQ